MTLERAVEILELHQKWRKGEIEEMPCEPKQLTKAENVVIKCCKEVITHNLIRKKSMDSIANSIKNES